MSHSLAIDPQHELTPEAGDEQDLRSPPQARRLRSEDLFIGRENMVLIEHRGAIYRLHKTRLGKLILNK